MSDLGRIRQALEVAREVVRPFTPGAVDYQIKSSRGDPLTEADEALDEALREVLPRSGEGWLSEETRDTADRLKRRRVWVVDPLDGTREFVDGIPEWCVSIGLVVDGQPVAGGILNPVTDQLILGAVGEGVTLNGNTVPSMMNRGLEGAVVLASRSESKRGEWQRFAGASLEVRPCGSVAYKLGLVAAGLADATWTLVPKSEWDVAAGAALIRAAGGVVEHSDGSIPVFNRPDPRLPNFLAAPPELLEEFRREWLDHPASHP